LFGTDFLKPQELFGLQGLDDITHCLFWSMLVNIGCYVGISLIKRPNAVEHGQATVFVDAFRHPAVAPGSRFWRGSASVNELFGAALAVSWGRSAPGRRSTRTPAVAAKRSLDALSADASLVHHAESLLAGAIGSASARVMVASVVEEEALGIDEVMNIIDEASQVLAYSRQLEQKSRELEAATKELRGANQTAARDRSPEGRFYLA